MQKKFIIKGSVSEPIYLEFINISLKNHLKQNSTGVFTNFTQKVICEFYSNLLNVFEFFYECLNLKFKKKFKNTYLATNFSKGDIFS